MRRYFTGLVPFREEQFKGAVHGRGWIAVLGRPRQQTRKLVANCHGEIVIEAGNAATAQRALYLIRTGHELIERAYNDWGYQFKIAPANTQEYERLYPNPMFDRAEGCLITGGLPQACRIAAKASRSRSLIYAFALFHLSQSIHSNHPMDLGPGSIPRDHRSPYPDDHVRFAYGIVAAYAVLEQLGLALHGEAFRNGEWIVEKKEELEGRLRSAGINLGELMSWQVRGAKTRIERARRTPSGKRAKWAFGAVRDIEIEVADAIADLRWLRSRVAAHDIKELAALISIYDVANSQDLARRCLGARLGYGE